MIKNSNDTRFIRDMREITNAITNGVSEEECTIFINDEFQIKVPLFCACLFSRKIFNQIKADPLNRMFNFKIPLNSGKEATCRFVKKIENIIKNGDFLTAESKEDFKNMLLIGTYLGNNYIFKMPNSFNDVSKDNIIDIILYKTIVMKDNNLSKEIKFIAEHFEEIVNQEDFISFAKNLDNINIIEQVIRSTDLTINDEDTLLDFIILLSKSNRVFTYLFEFVYLEHCTEYKCELFIDFALSVAKDREEISIIKCLANKISKKNEKQTNKRKYIEQIFIADDIEHLNGILCIENKKANLSFEGSTKETKGNMIENILEDKDNRFQTDSQSINSKIEASFKDKTSFIINKYLIRWHSGTLRQLRNWKLEGRKVSDGSWIVIDEQNNQQLGSNNYRIYDVLCNEKLNSIRLT